MIPCEERDSSRGVFIPDEIILPRNRSLERALKKLAKRIECSLFARDEEFVSGEILSQAIARLLQRRNLRPNDMVKEFEGESAAVVVAVAQWTSHRVESEVADICAQLNLVITTWADCPRRERRHLILGLENLTL